MNKADNENDFINYNERYTAQEKNIKNADLSIVNIRPYLLRLVDWNLLFVFKLSFGKLSFNEYVIMWLWVMLL